MRESVRIFFFCVANHAVQSKSRREQSKLNEFKNVLTKKGTNQQVLTYRKQKLEEKRNTVKQTKRFSVYLQFVGQEGVYRSKFFSEVKLTNVLILWIVADLAFLIHVVDNIIFFFHAPSSSGRLKVLSCNLFVIVIFSFGHGNS